MGGIHPERDPHDDAEQQRDADRPSRDACRERRQDLYQAGQSRADGEAGDPAEHRQRQRLGEKLAPDIAARGPERLANPDFARALGDTHEHDVHDDDAADDDADDDHGGHDSEDDARELGPERDQSFSGVDGEVVIRSRAQPVRDAHRFLDPQHRGRDPLCRRHLHRNHHRQAPPVHRFERGQRQHHKPVPRLPQHRALLRDHALHDQLNAAYPDAPANRGLDIPEELVGDVVAQDRDVAALLQIDVGERLPRGERVVLHDHIWRGDAEDEDVAGRAVAPLHVRHRRRPARLQGDRFGLGNGALDVTDVLRRDDRPALNLFPRLVVDESYLNRIAADLERIDADDRAGQPLADVRVHPLDDRDDRDQKGDGDDDAEQRKEGSESVAPDRLEREAECFVQRHGLQSYSYRNASMGSSCAARLAGYSPNPTPVSAEASSAATIDHSGTFAGIGGMVEMRNASAPPHSMPTAPPTRVSVDASTRNCHRIARFVAPRALRTPISRVRSVTEIIMIATTPTPPTINPIADRTSITKKNIPLTWCQESSSLSCVTIEKVFSWPGFSPRIERSVAMTSSIDSCCVYSGAGATASRIQPLKYGTCLTNEPCGIPTKGGAAPLKRLGGCASTPITVKGAPAIWIVWQIGSRPRNS